MTYQVLRTGMRDWAETVEAMASTIRWFEPMIVPGLLQTEEYMRAIFGARFGLTAEGIEERVTARLKRQEILKRDDPPALWVLIDEMVLRRPVGGRHVMLEQTNRLIEAARQPNIRIEVIPASVGAHDGLDCGAFILADFEEEDTVACLDNNVAQQYFKSRKDIASIEFLWATLRGEALPPGCFLGPTRGSGKDMEFSRVTWRKASYSGSESACVEVGVWRKASHSGSDNNCVEVGQPGGRALFLVRDSKDPDGSRLVFPRVAWELYLATVQNK